MRGFSLVELSIVLVILGLLTGGILAGQSLIRAAEIRTIASDYERYTTAVHSFRDKYFNLPGDMTNATQFWGVAGGNGSDATCYGTISTNAATCNGNGNGRLFGSDGVADGSAPEWYRAWQHLANAGMIEGTYTGKANGAPRGATPGVNVPRSKCCDAGFTLLSNDISTDGSWFAGRYDAFVFGKASASLETQNVALKPEEAWNLDMKLDDEKPAFGMVRALPHFSGCLTVVTSAAEYKLTDNTIQCTILLAISPPGR